MEELCMTVSSHPTMRGTSAYVRMLGDLSAPPSFPLVVRHIAGQGPYIAGLPNTDESDMEGVPAERGGGGGIFTYVPGGVGKQQGDYAPNDRVDD